MESSSRPDQSREASRKRAAYAAGELVVLGTLAAMTAGGSTGVSEDPLEVPPDPLQQLP